MALDVAGLAVAFALILFLGSRRTPLWLIMAAGAFILILAAGPRIPAAIVTAARAAVAVRTLDLVATVTLVTLLAGALKSFSLLEPLSRGLAGTLRSPRLAFALIPGILGCLPVVGGAGLSAPMVDGLGEMLGLSSPRKAAANLLLRHAWFFVFPFTPAMLLASHLSGLSIIDFIRFQWPVTVVALGGCFAFFLRGKLNGLPEFRPWRQEFRDLAAGASPIAIALVLYLILKVPLPIALAFGVGLGCLIAKRRGTFSLPALRTSLDWGMALTAEFVMIFAALVGELPVIPRLLGGITGLGIPLLPFIVMPPLLGFVTANPIAGVGISFPLLMPLIPAGGNQVAYLALMYGLTFQAYLMSPLHMCMIMTNRYYGVTAGQAYRYSLPVAAVNVAGVLLVCLSRLRG